jgi:hypothetical protein
MYRDKITNPRIIKIKLISINIPINRNNVFIKKLNILINQLK